MLLNGQVAVVTGAGQGIGRAIAEALAASGADVAVADIEIARAQDVVKAIEQTGRRGLAVRVNVAQAADVESMVAELERQWGRIEILVNNAGISRDALLVRMKPEVWHEVLSVNLTGAFYCTRAVVPVMMKQRYGRVVNIASIVGVMGNAGQAAYAASKAALIGFTKSVAREYATRGITVNAVAPGFIETAMTHALPDKVKEEMFRQIPQGRFGLPADVAQAVRFLASREAGYITGHVLHVNGGLLMP